ncbi:glutathione-dependent formaldehyde-activating [Rhypophila decipiens]|uniref:Glutathione-dependent formaldehyde-activating n=1 Tax=Rhypophila decipiens TaxID=261697 RepID=A0AAN6YK48_9PEZI|nr:glutathione-dependent formaldehyde-activating [Rhypophila decipiens]
MDAQCQCGAVSFKTPSPKPLALYICHCHECRRQTSSAFGASAIFPRFPLPDADLLSCYRRPLANGDTLHCYFCKQCGTRLIHSTPGKSVVSVKGGCIDGLDWKSAIHIWTKSAMVPIPEGADTEDEAPPATEHNQVESGQTVNVNTSASSSASYILGGCGGPLGSGDAGSVTSDSTAGTSPAGSDLAAYYRRVADILD